MTDRDRLVELLNADMSGFDRAYAEEMADYLIANGVICPPCKVGDTIYFETYKRGENIGIQPHKVANINTIVSIERPFGCVGADIYVREFGRTIFLTREEAEKALKERKEKRKWV